MNSRRPYQSASTRAITIAGIAVAVIALGVGGGYLGTTLTAATSTPAATTTAPSPADATTTGPASTATTGETTQAPATLRKGTVSTSTPAPATGAGGLPTGWPNTPEGAVAAATSYACWGSKWTIKEDDWAGVLDEFFTPAAQPQARQVLEVAAEYPKALQKSTCQPARGAYAVVSDGSGTTVLIWQPLLDSTDQSLKWQCLQQVDLRWEGSRWLIDLRLPTDVMCPEKPIGIPDPAEKARLLGSIAGYQPLMRVESWKQGGGSPSRAVSPDDAVIKAWTLSWREYADADR